MLCCGYTLTDIPISIRLTSLALWQSNDCPSASKATLMNMDKYFMWIHYERLHNHNKAKHNKTVCIFLGIYCISKYTIHIRICTSFCSAFLCVVRLPVVGVYLMNLARVTSQRFLSHSEMAIKGMGYGCNPPVPKQSPTLNLHIKIWGHQLLQAKRIHFRYNAVHRNAICKTNYKLYHIWPMSKWWWHTTSAL